MKQCNLGKSTTLLIKQAFKSECQKLALVLDHYAEQTNRNVLIFMAGAEARV